MIDLADNLPTLEPQPVMLRGERFYIRCNFSDDEFAEFRRLMGADESHTVVDLLVLDDRGPRLRELIETFPSVHATELYLRVFMLAGFTAEKFAGVI